MRCYQDHFGTHSNFESSYDLDVYTNRVGHREKNPLLQNAQFHAINVK